MENTIDHIDSNTKSTIRTNKYDKDINSRSNINNREYTCNNEFDDLKNREECLEEHIRIVNAKSELLKGQNEDLKNQIAEVNSINEQNQLIITNLRQKLLKKEQKFKKVYVELQKKEAIQNFQNDQYQKEISGVFDVLQEKVIIYKQKSKKYKQLYRKLSQECSEILILKNDSVALKAQLGESETQNQYYSSILAKIKTEIQLPESENNQIIERIASMNQQVRKLSIIEKENSNMKEQITQLENYKERNIGNEASINLLNMKLSKFNLLNEKNAKLEEQINDLFAIVNRVKDLELENQALQSTNNSLKANSEAYDIVINERNSLIKTNKEYERTIYELNEYRSKYLSKKEKNQNMKKVLSEKIVEINTWASQKHEYSQLVQMNQEYLSKISDLEMELKKTSAQSSYYEKKAKELQQRIQSLESSCQQLEFENESMRETNNRKDAAAKRVSRNEAKWANERQELISKMDLLKEEILRKDIHLNECKKKLYTEKIK